MTLPMSKQTINYIWCTHSAHKVTKWQVPSYLMLRPMSWWWSLVSGLVTALRSCHQQPRRHLLGYFNSPLPYVMQKFTSLELASIVSCSRSLKSSLHLYMMLDCWCWSCHRLNVSSHQPSEIIFTISARACSADWLQIIQNKLKLKRRKYFS